MSRADALGAAPAKPLSWRIAAWASVVVGVFIVQAAATPFHVAGASMLPYTDDGDLIVANRSIPPQRGDIVVLKAPVEWLDDQPDAPERIVKRVIAVAGDRISCCEGGGALVLNGEPLAEDYLAPGTPTSGIGFDVVVPPGHIWVLGDNRAVSRDSRLGVTGRSHGAVPLDDLIAVVWARLG